MRGVIRQSIRNDGGMTLVEILVATVILFVILTGVLGLVGTTTSMSMQAKQQNVLTNSLGGYVEWLHSLPFDQVKLVSDGGTLDLADGRHSFGIGEYQVQVTPSIAPGENDFLKEVTINIRVTRTDGEFHEYDTMVVIRDRSQTMTQADRSAGTNPTVQFGALTPPEGALIWGAQWKDGAAYIDFTATASEGRKIDYVYVYSGGYTLYTTGGTPSRWFDIDQAQWTSPTFVWDTTYKVPDLDGALYMPFAYGYFTVTIEAYDNYGGVGYQTRSFRVDNVVPGLPGPPNSTVTPSTASVQLEWIKPSGAPADGYRLDVRKQGATQTGTDSPFDGVSPWDLVGEYDVPEVASGNPGYAFSATHFSRYVARVFAKGPRYDLGDTSQRSAWTEGQVFVVRPLLSGSYRVQETGTSSKFLSTTSTLQVTEPTFPVAAVPVYRWYRSVGGATFEPLTEKTGPTISDTYNQPYQNNVQTPYQTVRYRVEVDYLAAGFQSGSGTVQSNRVSTTNTSVLTAFSEGTW